MWEGILLSSVKNYELIIKRGSHTFIHTKSPMTADDAAKIMLKVIDFKEETFKMRKIRNAKTRK